MKVESPRYYNELHGAFFEAAAAAGLARNPDFNEWNRPQVGWHATLIVTSGTCP
jgi:hypothetical protein